MDLIDGRQRERYGALGSAASEHPMAELKLIWLDPTSTRVPTRTRTRAHARACTRTGAHPHTPTCRPTCHAHA